MCLISFADPFSISSFFVPSINSDIFPDVSSLIDSLFPRIFDSLASLLSGFAFFRSSMLIYSTIISSRL